MKVERAGLLDVRSSAWQQHTCLVLPTLGHALDLWPLYVAVTARGHSGTQTTKTILIMRDTHTYLRLWVPYEREPTQPMDWEKSNGKLHEYHFVSPYGGRIQWP